MKENFEQRCEDLSERSLARRVLLRYCWRVRLLQKQRALYAGVRGKVLTRIRREALVCWHFVCERKREQKAFARRRRVERVSVLFEHWLTGPAGTGRGGWPCCKFERKRTAC